MPRIHPEARDALVTERKAQILSAAAKVFARKGFEQATIAEIAKLAGVAEGSIYNYFKNKSDLLVSIPGSIVQPAVQLLTAADVSAPQVAHIPPEQFLTLVARTLIDTLVKNADIVRVVMSTLPTMDRATQAKYIEQVPLYAMHALEIYFRAQVAAGVFRADVNPVMAARMFPGLLIPTLLIQELLPTTGATRIEYDALITEAVRVFLGGVLAQSPHPAAQTTARTRKPR